MEFDVNKLSVALVYFPHLPFMAILQLAKYMSLANILFIAT